MRGAELRLSNYYNSSSAAEREVAVSKARAGLARLQQWAQPPPQQLGTVLRVVPAQASAWPHTPGDKLVRLTVYEPLDLVGSGALQQATRALLSCCDGHATHLELGYNPADIELGGPWTAAALAEVA